ncbi:MAG: polysulfide reductase NrfD [Gammaproteobacteria bacterium]|nr:polysulfide reductase NrfD [Gammaproteobacteria bacterium]MCW8911147.1 polysulfide reductase NrfD [Gammaproteobacteria bacterium]MCW9005737.1 polysulfide reductase NrfD [Gammaproteobacteria bacterium]MCW9055895.1 polysulfide reductase NrfD [Gammaproteobacteria bacterium]
MKKIHLQEINGNSMGYLSLLAFLGAFVLAALGSTYYMEHNGHWVTGMNNQIVWGMPHVFAVFLIVAASGALNVASISSVFNQKIYKPLAPLSTLLALALLIGGLMILVLDLGRPDRLIVAMTKYNFKSIFAWNMILYNGFFVIVGVYAWFMLDRTMKKYSRYAGFAAFIWRLALTTGTGSIFGFLVARPGYDMAMMAPMFIIMSFSFGLAIYLLVLMASYNWTNRPLGDVVVNRLRKLLGVFVAAVLYFVIVYHLTNLYATEHHGFEAFMLLGDSGGSKYSSIFWIGQILLGSLIPLAMIYAPGVANCRKTLATACVLIIIGGLAQMYTIIIGGQAYPMEIFPGMEVLESTFADGVTTIYSASLPEILLGLGGMAMSMIVVALGIKVLSFLPQSLADDVADPHYKAE